MLPACDPTLTPDPPTPLPYTVTSFATAHTRTLAATEGAPDPDNITWHGREVAVPQDEEGNPIVLGLPHVARVAVGQRHACAISTTGTVHCWGDHTGGALGAHRRCTMTDGGGKDCVLGQDMMPTLPQMRAIAAGDDVTCAVALDDDRVMCWGAASRSGGSSVGELEKPVPVTAGGAPLAADRVLAFGGDVCAIDRQQVLWCWGDHFGALPMRQPQQGVVDVAIGRRHSCIIDANGLACWGDNTNAQISGDVAAARRCGARCVVDAPAHVDLGGSPVRVVVGELHTCALSSAGDVSCWGSNEVGQLGRDDVFLVGGIAPILSGIAELGAGYSHSCALGRDRSLWCWGSTTQFDPSETAR
ncbi:MAG: hypothetical protein KIT31_19765 [Deltaproteobacteria bacterium]|nr:hypothetical protein [Deltaproteobacteria bacterium]